MTRRTRTFEQVSDRDVIQRVAQAHGLQTRARPRRAAAQRAARRSTRATSRSCATRARAPTPSCGWRARRCMPERARAAAAPALKLTYGDRAARALGARRPRRTAHGRLRVRLGRRRQAGDRRGGDRLGDPVRARRRQERAGDAAAGVRLAAGPRRAPVPGHHERGEGASPRRACARPRGASGRGRGMAEGDTRIRVGAALDLAGLGALGGHLLRRAGAAPLRRARAATGPPSRPSGRAS